ncbi:MAG: GNAT family N-acetyltransferase [Clostridiaceae bacterium]
MREYFLTSNRLKFSIWNEKDVNLALELWGNSKVTKFITAKGKMSNEEIIQRLRKEIETYNKYKVQYWPIFIKETKENIGCCGLRPYDIEKNIFEIGVHLKDKYWGQGFAKEACNAVIKYAFKELSIEGLFAGHNPMNIASKNLLQCIGFKYTHDEFYPPTALKHPSYTLRQVDFTKKNKEVDVIDSKVEKKINDINNILSFLAKKDIDALSKEALLKKYGIEEVDLIIVLGNSIPYIAEIAAKAYKSGLSKNLMIAGGTGHATKFLINNILNDERYKKINTTNKSEAEILRDVVVENHHLEKEEVIIEVNSTNCGSNAYEALGKLKEIDKMPNSIIIIQDPTLQLRTLASFKKEWEREKTLIISYAPFIPKVKENGIGYGYLNSDIPGLWDKERLIDLIMGEIPRLLDDENGYGPNGKGFIDHVDIPIEVINSYKRLLKYYNEYNEIKDRL